MPLSKRIEQLGLSFPISEEQMRVGIPDSERDKLMLLILDQIAARVCCEQTAGTKLTVSINVAGNGAAISAGANSQSTGTVVFNNSNNVTFGMNAFGILTASVNQSDLNLNLIATGNTTQGTSGSAPANSLVFEGAGGVSLGITNNRVLISGNTGGGGAGSLTVSAGTTNNALDAISFANGGNVSFGLNGSTITASVASSLSRVNFSAGTTSQNVTNLVFSNSNGVTFGLNGSTITASHNGLTSQSNQNVTAGNGGFAFETLSFSNANGISFGTSAGSAITASHNALTSQSVQPGIQSISGGTTRATTGEVVFSNSNGISFGMDGNTMTASYTVPSTAGLISAINVSAGTTSNNLSRITFNNANGITFGLDASTITASHNGLTSQSNQAASAANGSFAFQTLSFSDANNVSFVTSAGSAIAGSAVIKVSAGTGSNNLSAITFSNSNNVSFGLNGSTMTGSYAFNVSAGTTSLNLSGVTFANSNGITFGIDNGTITASAASGGGGLTNINVSAGTTSNNLSNVVFSNSNGISFGLNGSTVTGSIPFTTMSGSWMGDAWPSPISANINTQASFNSFVVQGGALSFTRVDQAVSQNIATTNNNSTAGINITGSLVIFSRSGATLNSIASATMQASQTWSSNNTSNVTGAMILSYGLATLLTNGSYWFAVQLSTTNTGGIITGANTTALANTLSIGVLQGSLNVNYRDYDGASAASYGWFSGRGINSSTGNITEVSMSNITVSGTLGIRGAVALRFQG